VEHKQQAHLTPATAMTQQYLLAHLAPAAAQYALSALLKGNKYM
jgi:hypothetical protein